MPDANRQRVIDSVFSAMDRTLTRAPVALRALLIAGSDGGGDVAVSRLALRIVAELDGFVFDTGWKFGRPRETFSNLHNAISNTMLTVGGVVIADVATGHLASCWALAEAIADEFEKRGIAMAQPGVAANKAA